MNLVPSVLAATPYTDEAAANKLANLGIIVNQAATPAAYNLNTSLLRQEAVKVVAGAVDGNILQNEASYVCKNLFSDTLANTGWVCRVAELARAAGLVAPNPKFNPTAKLSKLEAVIFALRAADLMPTGNHSPDTILGYAVSAGMISTASGFAVNASATRGEFFRYVARGLDVASDLPALCVAIPELCTNNNNNTGGAVSVSLGSSLASGTQVPKAGTIKFGTVNFVAGSNSVSLNTVNLNKVGLATIPTSTRVWFEKNGTRVTGKSAFSSDGTAVIAFAPAYAVPANSTASLDLYVELATDSGVDFQFSGTIGSSTATSSSGSFTTPVLRTAEYSVAPVTVATTGSSLSVNQSADVIELGRFTVANNDVSSETRDVRLQSIMLRQGGTGDLVDISDLRLERNGVVVSTAAVSNGKDVTFTINDTVKDAATATYYVKGKVGRVQNNAGDTYIFSVRNTSDVNAVEFTTGFRSTVTGTPTLSTYTVTGSDLVFARDTAVELAKSYAKGTSDVVLAKGTITAKSAVTLEDVTLAYTSVGTNGGINTGAANAFTTVYLQIGSSVMTWTPGAAATAATATFNGLATVNGTVDFKIWAKIKDNSTLTSFKFNDVNLTSFTKKEYVSSQNNVTSAVGSIASVTVSIDAPALAVTRTDGLGATTIAPGTVGVVVNTLSLAVSQGNNLVIATPVYTIVNSVNTSHYNNATATLFIDGTAVSTKTVTGATVSFDANRTITKTPTSMSVKVDFNSAFTTGNFKATLTGLDITDALTSAPVNLPTVPASAVFTIGTAAGTASASDLNPDASAILAGAKDQKILAFRVKATSDSVKIRDLDIDGTNLDKLSNFRILTPTGVYITSTSSTALKVLFTNISITDTVLMDKTDTYYLVADTNTNVDGVAFTATLNAGVASGSKVKSTDGTVSDLLGADVASLSHIIVENRAIITKDDNINKALTTSALRFKVSASGKDPVILTELTLNALFSGYVGTAASIAVYKTNTSATNLLGTSATFNAATNTAPITVTLGNGNNSVDPTGVEVKYIVVVKDILVNSASNSQDWNISITDLEFDHGVADILVSDYQNLGDLPITSVK
jgi:hypothetical protein